VARAESALAAGRPEEAVYLYLAAAMLTPGSAAPLVRAGAIQESRHELGGALRAYEGALARSPDDAALVAKVGLLLAQAGRDPAAELVLRDALGRTPTDWRLLDALGRLADRRLDRAAARARYDEALKIAPRSAPVLNNRGYSRLLDGDLEGAEEDFRAALAAGPLDAARVNLGTVLARKGDYAGALERLNGPLAESEALYRVGVAALDRHERERAADYLDRATRAAPTYFEAAHVALAQAQRPDAP
jgi:Flp pilus assembly protein TadD